MYLTMLYYICHIHCILAVFKYAILSIHPYWNSSAYTMDLCSSFNILSITYLKHFYMRCRNASVWIFGKHAASTLKHTAKTKRIFDYVYNHKLMHSVHAFVCGIFFFHFLLFSVYPAFLTVSFFGFWSIVQVVTFKHTSLSVFISLNCRNMLKWDCRHEK